MSELSTILQILLRSLETGSVFALTALAIIIIFRTSIIIHFAQSTMSMFGTFTVAYIISVYGAPIWVGLTGGLLCAVLMGFLVDFLIIRRTKKVTAVGKEIITLALIMVFLGLTPMVFGVETRSLKRFIQSGDLMIGSASISYNAILNILIGFAILGALFYILQKTKFGLAVRGTASNEETARLMGVPTRLVTLMAWVVAGILGTLSGVMIAPATSVHPMLMNPIQLGALFACVFGGFQTFHGPIIGAYIIGIVPNFLSYYISSVWGTQIMYVFILIFLLFRPNGLIGKKFIKKV